MTLSERLEHARTQRLIAAGLVHSEAALKPESGVAPSEPSLTDPIRDDVTIEVTAGGLATVAEPPTAGAPVRMDLEAHTTDCPNCHRAGKVDMVDLVGHTVHLSCAACGTLWRAPHTVTQPAR